MNRYVTLIALNIVMGLLAVGTERSMRLGVQPGTETAATEERLPPPVELSERDAEVIEMVLRSASAPSRDRIYFLTTTPKSEWGPFGQWADLPGEFHERIKELGYRPASEAQLVDSRVLERGTGKEAWMRWVTIKRWLSDTEVEVEKGVWCCPLGGGASTITYEKVDGKWEIKELGKMWVS